MIKRLLLAAAVAVLALGWVGTAPSAQAATFTACDGVWVVVDYGALGGGVTSACAASFSTGTAALRSAGFDPSVNDGFVEKISGKPAKSEPTKSYWSYWQATRKSDGSYGSWSYSSAGSNAYHPKKGDAEGWHYVSLSDPASGPDATPTKNPAAAVTPTPTPTKSASTKPTKKATASATTSASTSAKASGTATATASAEPTALASASPSAAEPSPTPSAVAPGASTDVTTSAAEAPTVEAPPPASGSPAGTIAAGVAVFAAVGGLGSWWLVKGRRN